MRTPTFVIPAIAIIAFCSATPWAAADPQRERGNRGRDEKVADRKTPSERNSDNRANRDAQASAPQSRGSQASAPQSRGNQPVAASPRDSGSRGTGRSAGETVNAGPARTNQNGASYRSDNSNRGGSYSPRDSSGNRGVSGQSGSYGPRGSSGNRDWSGYGGSNSYRGSNGGRDSYGYGGSYSARGSYGYRDSYWYRGSYSHHAYYRGMPYYGYSWRPYLSLGFGMWAGYPMMLPAESYYYSRSVTYASYGALSFEVAPGEAYVFVDGNYVGTARDFGPYTQPLTLSVGMHRIAIDAPGYRGIEFGVEVLPGQLIPYRGQLEFLGQR